MHAFLRARIRQRASRPALSRQRRDRRLRGGARERAPLPQRRARSRRSCSPARRPRRSTSSRRATAAAHRRGRRDRALDHGAPRQHRALAFPARAQGRGAEVGRRRRRRLAFGWKASPRRSARAPSSSPSPRCRTCSARRRRSKEIVAHGACARHSRAGGRLAGRRARDVDVRDLDVDFYRRHRPQALRSDRDRRALRQGRAAGRHCRPSTAAAR